MRRKEVRSPTTVRRRCAIYTRVSTDSGLDIWVGGVVPLGYRVVDRKLVIDPSEAETVRSIFERYLVLKSLPELQRELREIGTLTRRRELATGKAIGGVALTNGALAYLLRNRVYLGELNHRGKSYPGAHQAIIDVAVFEAVQTKLTANRNGFRQRRSSSDALLLGRIFDDRGHRMTPSYAIKKGCALSLLHLLRSGPGPQGGGGFGYPGSCARN
jgi:site-specific DNA recombinase